MAKTNKLFGTSASTKRVMSAELFMKMYETNGGKTKNIIKEVFEIVEAIFEQYPYTPPVKTEDKSN